MPTQLLHITFFLAIILSERIAFALYETIKFFSEEIRDFEVITIFGVSVVSGEIIRELSFNSVSISLAANLLSKTLLSGLSSEAEV